MHEHTELLIEQLVNKWLYTTDNMQMLADNHFQEVQQQTVALERVATSHELLAERIKYVSWLAALMLGLLIGVLITLLLSSLNIITLFEDGSIQFFQHAGWGFCLFPSGGCS